MLETTVGEPDATRGTVVKAFIVLAAGEKPSAELEASLQQHVRKYLAPYEYPKEIEFIDALPMTPHEIWKRITEDS